MLHNNHIIKTLSNTILSLSLVCLIFNSANIYTMAANQSTKTLVTEAIKNGKPEVMPGPSRPPHKP